MRFFPQQQSSKPLHKLLVLCGLILVLFSSSVFGANPSTPSLRPFYPTVRTVSTERFLELYFDALVVDVRSQFEFDVIHISKAKHVSVAGDNFVEAISRYRARKSSTPIIFYSNDFASANAFRAALVAQQAGFQSVHVYDAGVFSLLDAASEKVTLLATTPAQPDLVIPADYYNSVRVDFDEFSNRSAKRDAMLIDIRDIYNRIYVPRLTGVKNIPVESFIKAVTNRIWWEKTLLVFDQSGEDTKWLQYFLQANGYSDYLFLRDGVDGLDLVSQARKIIRPDSWLNINQRQFSEMTMDRTLRPLDLRVMNLLAGAIGFENKAMVNRGDLIESINSSIDECVASFERLRRGGYLLFGESDNLMIFYLNPRLAWKGEMSGSVWADRVREFDASTSGQESLD